MNNRIRGAHLKVQRAKKHIAELEPLIAALPDAYTSSAKFNVELAAQEISYAPRDADTIPEQLALLFGDVVHNLRTAIEYAYLDTVERLAPTVLDSRTKFPIYDTRAELEGALRGRKIHELSPILYEGVTSKIKPYRTADGNILVCHLHDLDVSDKHLLLIPLLTVTHVTGLSLKNKEGQTVVGETLDATGSGFQHAIFVHRNAEIQDHGKVSVSVCLKDVGLLQTVPIPGLFHDFSKTTVGVIDFLQSL